MSIVTEICSRCGCTRELLEETLGLLSCDEYAARPDPKYWIKHYRHARIVTHKEKALGK